MSSLNFSKEFHMQKAATPSPQREKPIAVSYGRFSCRSQLDRDVDDQHEANCRHAEATGQDIPLCMRFGETAARVEPTT